MQYSYIAWGTCPPPGYGQSVDHKVLLLVRSNKGKGKRLKRILAQEDSGLGKSIKTIVVIFLFSNMADEILEERQRILNRYSNIPQSFFCGDIVITQPTEREILLSQIEPWEWTPCVLGYPSVDEYIFRKQYKEANGLDDIRMGEYEVHIHAKTRGTYGKWYEEGPDGAGVLKEDRYTEATLGDTCAA